MIIEVPVQPLDEALRTEIARTGQAIHYQLNTTSPTMESLTRTLRAIGELRAEREVYRHVQAALAHHSTNNPDSPDISRHDIDMALMEAALGAQSTESVDGTRIGIRTVRQTIHTIPAATVPALLGGIDWYLLRDQKHALLRTIQDFVDYRDPDDPDADLLGGLVHLIDAIQDTADTMGLIPADAWLTEDDR